MTEETITDLLCKIKEFLYYKSEKSTDDILLADELNSANYYDSSYKIIDIFKHDYIDYHFQFEDKEVFYDVFVYQDEEINYERMYQLILCDNYVEIVRFIKDNYDKRIMVTEFKLPQRIYSFYDRGVVIVEKSYPTKGIEYKKI